MIITPTAKAGSIRQNYSKANATNGKKNIWLTAPIKKSWGWTATSLKSASVSSRPTEYMMNVNDNGRNI